jgi:hypothetical protein
MSSTSIDILQDAIDNVRLDVWNSQGKDFKRLATVEMDATIVETDGECKGGMDISYKNVWGYHSLLFTLAETGEVLRLTNRGGNARSGHNAFKDADKIIALCKKAGFERVMLRGDTVFTQTEHLDRWDRDNVEFVFGIAKHANLLTKNLMKFRRISGNRFPAIQVTILQLPIEQGLRRSNGRLSPNVATRSQIERRGICRDTVQALQMR